MKEERSPEIPREKSKNNYLLIILSVLVALLTLSTAWLGWQYSRLSSDKKQLQSSADNLSQKLSATSNELKAAKATPTPTPAKTSNVTQSLKENVVAAMNTKNTAALENYMASSVNVVLAASEGVGSRTPAQAVGDLNYLEPATSPWNFSLPATTIAAFRNGFYSRYFGDNTVAGQAANGYVVSFGVNASGKIDTIFMAVSADLLK
ncbi:MAG: hypothetical protein M0R39_17595 [Prolixibacteraceae bacterium]|nr:hypothetical protein [Prolixibacteraceae bacterium]